jgi:hypothetical protein
MPSVGDARLPGWVKSSLQPRVPATPGPEVKAEETGLIPDIRSVMSEAEGKLSVPATWSARRVIAESVGNLTPGRSA